jgi:transcription elongation factor Elf1
MTRSPNYDKYLARNRERYQKRKRILNGYKTSFGCERCGYNEHPACLDLHHKEKGHYDKTGNFAHAGKSWTKIMEQLLLCEVLCANCHRLEHAA